MCCLHVAEVFVVVTAECQEVPCSDCYTSVHDVRNLEFLFFCWYVSWKSICEETL
jgi:hypothetical protein